MKKIGMLWMLWMVSLHAGVWNAPYPPSMLKSNTLFSVYRSEPKTLDPAQSYTSNEITYLANILVPLLQYEYPNPHLVLKPFGAKSWSVYYANAKGDRVPPSSPTVASTHYVFTLRDDMFYQPHPAFVVNAKGEHPFWELSAREVDVMRNPQDLPRATRKVIAADYVYQIKRLGYPPLSSPIYGMMASHLKGLSEFFQDLQQHPIDELALYHKAFVGARVIDDTHFEVVVKGRYPAMPYWFAMTFFTPVPVEGIAYFQQPLLKQRNWFYARYPIASGPFYLADRWPAQKIILAKQPHYFKEYDADNNPLVHIDGAVFTFEKESLTYWNKFLQGYYDRTPLLADQLHASVHVKPDGTLTLQSHLEDKKLRLTSAMGTGIFYIGFYYADSVVGGEQGKYLRQALNIAIDYRDYIRVFLQGQGVPADGPIPPVLRQSVGSNPIVCEGASVPCQWKRLSAAKALLKKSGYPNGISEKTHQRLRLLLDMPGNGSPEEKEIVGWLKKQFARVGIVLQVRMNLYPRFLDRLLKGNTQLFLFGWHADYPDAENFFQLFYGAHTKISGGENASAYHNAQFDKVFKAYRLLMREDPKRVLLEQQLLKILWEDSPWIWGYYPKSVVLSHDWVSPLIPIDMIPNTLKYVKITPQKRLKAVLNWNRPERRPLWAMLLCILLTLWVAKYCYQKQLSKKPWRE